MQSDEERREELGNFLKSRRERLTPVEVGLPIGNRRRTPGLRREEVAMLADVGLSWYTWLEQGRAIKVSADMLERLSRALRLDKAQHAHLFMLAHQRLPITPELQREQVTDAMQRVLDALLPTPAYIIGRRWDVLAWNEAAQKTFFDFAASPPPERNMIWFLFACPLARRLFAHWEQVAQYALALFRVDIGCYNGPLSLPDFIGGLEKRSREFRQWWREHDVCDQAAIRLELNHPTTGRLIFEQSAFQVDSAPALKMIVCVPLKE